MAWLFLFPRQRKCETKACALASIERAFTRERSPDFGDAPCDDRKPEPRARRFRREKRLKNPAANVGGNSRAVILHLDFEPVRIPRERDAHAASIWLGFDGVHDQIRQHFAQRVFGSEN